MAQHIDVFQSGGIILAVAPELLATDGDRIGNAEVVKGTEEFFFQGFGQPNLRREAVAEILRHIITIHPLRCSGQTKEDLRDKVVKDRSVAGGCAMMDLIDDHVVVEVAANLLPQSPACQHPNGAKQVLQATGLILADL